jgi:hypothetical protein
MKVLMLILISPVLPLLHIYVYLKVVMWRDIADNVINWLAKLFRTNVIFDCLLFLYIFFVNNLVI